MLRICTEILTLGLILPMCRYYWEDYAHSCCNFGAQLLHFINKKIKKLKYIYIYIKKKKK